MNLKKIVGVALISLSMTSVFADETNMKYEQKTLPNGDKVMEYSATDGTKIKQTLQKDRTKVMESVDANGNRTTTITHPDGSVDSKTVSKQP